MSGSRDEEQFRHEISPWTVGQLCAAMADLPDDVPIEVAVAEQPGGVFVNLQVVMDAAPPQDGTKEFTIACEYPSGTYIRPAATRTPRPRRPPPVPPQSPRRR